MFTLAILAVAVGCVVSQRPQPDPQSMSPMPWGLEGCDIQGLQSCISPYMTAAMMRRGPDMSLTSSMQFPTLDTSCKQLEEVRKCIMPKMSTCGPEATSAVSAAFEAVDYLCVEARNETQRYMNCLLRDNNAVKFTVCMRDMMTNEMAILAQVRDPRAVQVRLCGLIQRYEVCAERKAGSICNEEALMTHFFSILNKGLSFLQCPQLGVDSVTTKRPHHHILPTEGRQEMPEMPISEGNVEGNRPNFGHIERNLQCIQRAMSGCISPSMAFLASSGRFDVDQVCQVFERAEKCMVSAESMCGPDARKYMESMKRIFDHLCFEKKQEFKEVGTCLMKDTRSLDIQGCLGPLSGLVARGDFDMEKTHKSFEMQEIACRGMESYTNCVSDVVEKRCGYKARDLLDSVMPEMYHLMENQMGLSCPTDQIDIADVDRHHHRHHRRHMALLVALPIVGVVVVAIIVAVIVAIVRRRGAARRQQLEKSDLVKNDVLQQNLRFAITQTPKEKSQDGLRV
ncbi:uncharacterized protein LOC135467755 [Liolophura sinensis]|uniref:uncharacterized protein LOC135467755 n=1 Tax=Liolophura sinensis TaxID=3198878 RepID=UPI003158DA94